MFHRLRRAALLGVAAAALAVTAPAAPIQAPLTETIKDRASFIPQRKYVPLQGTAVGVLVSNVAPMMGQEGRGGPPDAQGFSAGGNSYRWMYVPVTEKPLILNLRVNVGPDGAAVKTYPTLSMANPQTVRQWNIDAEYALVEVQVNDALGAPAQEGFVATQMRRLDGTKDFPAKLTDVVADARKRQQQVLKDQQKEIDAAFAEVQKSVLKDKKLTGPRETHELFYITWLPETERYRLHFRTTVTDGAYETRQNDPRLPPMPPGGLRRPPPPPLPLTVRVGTQVSVEYGVAFEVSKSGKVERVLILPPQATSKEINEQFRGPGRPIETPPPPRPMEKE